MTVRTALLVLAHRPAPLQALLDVLGDAFDIFVHFDAKAGAPALRLPDRTRLVAPAIEVFWGGWSMMQATLALLAAARAEDRFGRYALISGDALPVRAPSAITAALADAAAEYIDLVPVPDDPTLAGTPEALGIERHGWVQPWRFHNPVHWDHRLLNPTQRMAVAARYAIAQPAADFVRGEVELMVADILRTLRPPRPALCRSFWYGAQWWALTEATVAAIWADLHDPAVQAFFRFMQVPDEHMVQTVLGNRPDVLAGRRIAGTPMFTDHARRSRGDDTLDATGFRTASSRGAQFLFARKFDPAGAPDMAAAISDGHFFGEILAAACHE